jgi:dipeptidyl aminopeptidase/acylaminoacyl peptidase
VDLDESNALRAVENNKYPILFIHGSGDTFIKPRHSEQLREAASKNGAYTELVLVEGAGHARCRYVAGFETYTGYIENFLKKIGV